MLARMHRVEIRNAVNTEWPASPSIMKDVCLVPYCGFDDEPITMVCLRCASTIERACLSAESSTGSRRV